VSEPYGVPPDFRDAVAELLYHSQMLESLLRVYLSDVNEIADLLLQGEGVRFKNRTDAFEVPLGRLVDLFEAHSDNADLVKRLRSFIPERNTAAHIAYVWGFVNNDRTDKVVAELGKVRKHCGVTRGLVEAMTAETIKTYGLKTDPRLHLLAETKLRRERPSAGS
jgi:hypothetical protein